MRNDFFGEMAETGGVPLNASPVRRWAGVFGHRPFAFSISMGVKTSDGMNWNLQDLVYEALSEEWRKRDGEISDPWANDEADGYQPRTAPHVHEAPSMLTCTPNTGRSGAALHTSTALVVWRSPVFIHASMASSSSAAVSLVSSIVALSRMLASVSGESSSA